MLPGIEKLAELLNSVDEETLSDNDKVIKNRVLKDITFLSNLNVNDPKDLQKEVTRILKFYKQFEKGQ